jgi:hypothetical protein
VFHAEDFLTEPAAGLGFLQVLARLVVLCFVDAGPAPLSSFWCGRPVFNLNLDWHASILFRLRIFKGVLAHSRFLFLLKRGTLTVEVTLGLDLDKILDAFHF